MELLTIAQVSERLHVSYRLARELIRSMPIVRIGGRIRVSESDLELWVRNQREQPARVSDPLPPPARSTAVLTPQGRIPRRRITAV